MTLRWVEGFEIDGGTGYLQAKYQNIPTVTIGGPGRVFGKYCQGALLVTPVLATSPIDEWVIGIGWYTGTNPDPTTDFISFYNGGLRQLSLHLRADRLWEVRRGATVIATGTTQMPNLDWGYVEFKALLHPSAGSYEVRIDGVTEMSGTSVNTADAAINDADTVVLRSNANNRYDDIYILDTAGGVRANFLGPRVVEGLLPVGDGDTTEWTPSTGLDHYVLVDDAAAVPDTGDFVSSATVGHDDLYSLDDLKFITGDISGVAVSLHANLDGVASRTVRVKYRSSADAEGNGPTLTIDSTQPQSRIGVMEEDPSGTPDRWTPDDINAGQFGVEVVS